MLYEPNYPKPSLIVPIGREWNEFQYIRRYYRLHGHPMHIATAEHLLISGRSGVPARCGKTMEVSHRLPIETLLHRGTYGQCIECLDSLVLADFHEKRSDWHYRHAREAADLAILTKAAAS